MNIGAASILVIVGAVYAADEPPLKEGLWSIKAQNFKTISENRTGATLSTESECSAGGTVIRTKGTVTMTGDTAWAARSPRRLWTRNTLGLAPLACNRGI